VAGWLQPAWSWGGPAGQVRCLAPGLEAVRDPFMRCQPYGSRHAIRPRGTACRARPWLVHSARGHTALPRAAVASRCGMSASRPEDPFAALGLPARPGLADDEVRAAWRRIAAATHPDRADGGDPGRFAAAAAAYTALRTQFGRSEALADLTGPRGRARLSVPYGPAGQGDQRRWRRASAGLARLPARVRHGRPLLLALRLAAVAAVSTTVVAVAGSAPATPALITGALPWLLLTARHDLAPPR
jgi:hypothetical protein